MLAWLPRDEPADRTVPHRLDPVGLTLFAAALTGLLVFLMDLGAPRWWLLGATAVALVALTARGPRRHQRGASRLRASPLAHHRDARSHRRTQPVPAGPPGALPAQLVIRTEARGFPENDWLGRDLRVGDDLVVRVIARTPRCAVPTLAHGDLPRDAEALRVLARYNRVAPLAGLDPEPCAGVYAEVLHPGPIRVGDAVRVTAASRTPAR